MMPVGIMSWDEYEGLKVDVQNNKKLIEKIVAELKVIQTQLEETRK